ncbi:hypothetical protein LX81_02958 [Palleronia aestuarii]|uniref:Alpha/beta hydrolase family protein n=1 Tax=Palleronia aestuarii TaxID=568105 RepID=A0A2W7N1U5_9RHOB|nr:hypothetical protein [Palleronia aestuarii]PZX14375.1 hypothetical protein LX81_02958 [Palleronia aestuarii]
MTRTITISVALAALAATAQAQDGAAVNDGAPAPDCSARVNYNVNDTLPGYADPDGICHPFTATYSLVPDYYEGEDYYVEEFTDKRIRARWQECSQDDSCPDGALEAARGFTGSESQDTGTVDPEGRIDPEGDVDLADIRRPSYFGTEAYAEPIADAEDRTFTVEFTVPRDTYETEFAGLSGDIHLRGWYLAGDGVEGPEGETGRALVIMNNGGGGEITAIDQRGFEGFVYDPETGDFVRASASDGASEEPGMRTWRGFLADLNAAGFDVLVTDRRGNGISGGQHGYDTAEQGRDMFRELDQLSSGEGLRVLTPGGEEFEGMDAVEAIYPDGDPEALPIVLGGYSRGSYAVAWAMQQNFVEDCDHGTSPSTCTEPRGDERIKGAILYGPNPGGLGYRAAGHDMEEAALREEFHTAYRLDGDVLANLDAWPALQLIRGTWDYVEGMEGTFDAFGRAGPSKDIFVFHGPHGLGTQSPQAMALVGERMVAFARAAVNEGDGGEGFAMPSDMRELVLSAPPHWELTTPPQITRKD